MANNLRNAVFTITAFSLCLGVALAAPAVDQYVLGPGDTISITVFGLPEYSVTGAQVRPDGKISHPFLGEIMVDGITPLALADKITEALRSELKDPLVTVSLVGLRERRVYVIGEVAKPGGFDTDVPLTIAKAIALAGDLTETADRSSATLVPKDGPPTRIDLQAALTSNGAGLQLNPGDTLIVAPADNTVMVWGPVARQGRYDLPPENMKLSELLAAAGGLTARANERTARLVHADGSEEVVDLWGLLQERKVAADLQLRHGDMLFITEQRNEVLVLGEGVKQGSYPLVKGDRVSDLLAQIGGVPRTVDLDDVRLVRNGEVSKLDVRAILRDQSMAANIELQPGDAIFFSELRRRVLVFGHVGSPGEYDLEEGDRLLDIISRAGSLVPRASDAKNVAVVHKAGETYEVKVVNLFDAMNGKRPDHNVELQDDDIIIVPHKSVLDWREFLDVLFKGAGVYRLFTD